MCVFVCLIYLSLSFSVPPFVCLSLTVCLSACLSVCLSIRLFVYLSLSVSPSVSLSLCLSVCLCLHLSVCLFVCLSVCVSLSVRLSFCLSVCLFVCLSAFLSVCLLMSVCLCHTRAHTHTYTLIATTSTPDLQWNRRQQNCNISLLLICTRSDHVSCPELSYAPMSVDSHCSVNSNCLLTELEGLFIFRMSGRFIFVQSVRAAVVRDSCDITQLLSGSIVMQQVAYPIVNPVLLRTVSLSRLNSPHIFGLIGEVLVWRAFLSF